MGYIASGCIGALIAFEWFDALHFFRFVRGADGIQGLCQFILFKGAYGSTLSDLQLTCGAKAFDCGTILLTQATCVGAQGIEHTANAWASHLRRLSTTA